MNERIQTLDVLRGIAVLGLPIMNMVVFAMPLAAYYNPTVFDGSSYINHFLFSLFHIFADQKFMGLFSLLFGAGIILLAEKRKSKGQGTVFGHYSRMLWLLVFGALHTWFIWFGDILAIYAVIGLFAFPMYKASRKFLLTITIISLSLSVFISSNPYATSAVLGPIGKAELLEGFAPTSEYMASIKAQRLSPSYSENMRPDRKEFQEGFHDGLNDSSKDGLYDSLNDSSKNGLDKNTNTNPNNSADTKAEETNNKVEKPTTAQPLQSAEELNPANPAMDQLLIHSILKIFGLMSLGMLLYRSGFLSGQRSTTEYQLLAQFGLIIGMSFTLAALFWNYSHAWQAQAFFEYGMLFSAIGSIAMTLGYVGLIVLAHRNGFFGRATALIANVGQMALSNYLMQSIICILIFYGFGLGLYGSLTRLGLIPIIVLLCAFQIVFSKYWLHFFAQGPFEWLLRTLSSFSFQPLRKANKDTLVSE